MREGRCRDDGVHDGFENMARDVALLGRGLAARVYGWDGAWVSLGASQQPGRTLLPGAPVRWVRRPTGGKAVLHGCDATIGLAVPLAALPLGDAHRRSVTRVYRSVVPWLIEALRACGVPAALGEQSGLSAPGRPTADCFAHVAPNDIVDERTGAKVCGCALRLTEAAVLVQASVPTGPPVVDPSSVFASPAPLRWVELERAALAEALAQVLAEAAAGRSLTQ